MAAAGNAVAEEEGRTLALGLVPAADGKVWVVQSSRLRFRPRSLWLAV